MAEGNQAGGVARRTLMLEGELTISSAAAWKPRLLEALDGPLDVDLSGVTLLDGAGLQLLVMLGREAERRAVPLAWQAPSRAVQAVFERLRIDPAAFACPGKAVEGAA